MHLDSSHWSFTLVTMLSGKEGADCVMIFNVDVHIFKKIGAVDHQLVVCSLKLMKEKRAHSARRFHHELTQCFQAGVDETCFAKCELWFKFGIPLWVEGEQVGYPF